MDDDNRLVVLDCKRTQREPWSPPRRLQLASAVALTAQKPYAPQEGVPPDPNAITYGPGIS
jgi:hypothetical protein